MKASSRKVKKMDLGSKNLSMAINIRGFGKIIKWREKELFMILWKNVFM
jgi:hypothetical protein